MSHFDSSWMSCRQSHSRPPHISLLPQFNVPPEVTDFALERRPPHLPPRNSPSWMCVMGTVLVFCILGSYSTVSASQPMMQHSSNFVSGVTSAVGRAISHANTQAEKHAQQHYEAREEYMNRRRLSRRSVDIPDHEEPRAGAPQPSRPSRSALPSRATEGFAVATPKSDLLMKMAALRTAGAVGSRIDDGAVERFFPAWVVHQHHDRWDEDVVLKDLVLAVSQLADAALADRVGAASNSLASPRDDTPTLPELPELETPSP